MAPFVVEEEEAAAAVVAVLVGGARAGAAVACPRWSAAVLLVVPLPVVAAAPLCRNDAMVRAAAVTSSSLRIASRRGRHSGQASASPPRQLSVWRRRHDAVRHCSVGHVIPALGQFRM